MPPRSCPSPERPPLKRNLPLAVAGVVLATALSGAIPAAATTAPEAPTAQPAAQQQWITLITGDQVLTDDNGKPKQWKPAPGREHIMVATREDGAHHYAVPQDVESMITEGRLDRRLFDLALLSR